MVSSTTEGVIKFQLDFADGPAPPAELLRELNAWRSIFLQLGLIGQDPRRYAGYGFGNLSRRLPDSTESAFFISGTQTGHLAQLRPEDYATVLWCNPTANQLTAKGQIKPSSEALSHGILYRCDPKIHWVMHLHAPAIFRKRQALGLPATDPAAAYGTPEMAEEIQRLATKREKPTPGLLVMSGHEDGILAYGSTAAETGSLVITTLAAALQLNETEDLQNSLPLAPR